MANGTANLSLKHGKPVTVGFLLTDSIEQAIGRAGSKAGNKGFEAMAGLVELISLFDGLK